MRLVSQVMVAPLLVGGPRRYLITTAYGVAGILAGVLWLIVPLALWRSFGMSWTFLWLLPTTISIFALTFSRDDREAVPNHAVAWPDEDDEDPDAGADADLPEGYQDWLAEIMQPPPRWYRVAQWIAIAVFSLLFAVVVMEQWLLWMVVTVELFDPWAIVIGIAIAAIQMLLMFKEKTKSQTVL